MADVAASAGVSVATVSRVLSGRDGVRPETVARVRAAADGLGYRYNGLAAALRQQRTKLVGCCVPRIANPYFAALVEALEHELAGDGLELLIADARDDDELERGRVTALLERQVDALVIAPTGRGPLLATGTPGVPCVLVDREVPGLDADWVGVDNRGGVAAVVAHLRAAGHERFAFVGAAADDSVAAERLAGFRDHVDGPVLQGELSMDGGRAAAAEALRRAPGTTAIVCANDLIAYGVLAWAHDEGRDVPGELAVTGFDDLPFSAITRPGLTSVRQPLTDLAATVAATLRDRLGGVGGSAPRRTRLPVELVVRGSS